MLGPFCVDLATSRLSRGGATLELRPRAFRALQVLLQNPGRQVGYEQMIRDAWDGVRVSKHTVAVTVGEIKEKLAECGSWITCRPKFGYRLEIPQSEDLFVTGRHFRNQFTQAGFLNALHCFERAAVADSADYRAFGAIANVNLMLAAFLLREPGSVVSQFERAYRDAVALHPPSQELRLDHAYSRYVFEGDIAQAEAELLQLHRERAFSAELNARLAMVYLAQHRLDDALSQIKQASSVDLLVPPLTFVRTRVLIARREFDQAISNGRHSLELHPSSQFGRIHYAEALEHAGDYEAAIKQYKHAIAIASDVPWMRATMARCLAKFGRHEEAFACLEELLTNRAHEYVDAYHLALLLHALGRRDDALHELERARREGSYMLLLIDVDPKMDALRNDGVLDTFSASEGQRLPPGI